jgi:hypothetical protein
MFVVWTIVGYRAAWASRRPSQGVAAGAAVAFATFCVFMTLSALRVNLFLGQLVLRPDWQDLMIRFQESGSRSLRLFVTLDYLRGAPLKIAAATVAGMLFGSLGVAIAWRGRVVQYRQTSEPELDRLQPRVAGNRAGGL